MKGEVEDGKITEPMFPRLNVNDRERGGPRAPPRNKMALCEKLSASSSSHMFDSPAAASVPVPTLKGAMSAPSASARQSNEQRTRSSPSDLPPKAPVYSFGRIHSQSSKSMNGNYIEVESGRSSKRQANNDAWIRNRLAGTSCHSSNSASANKSWKNIEDEYMVPTFVQSSTGKSYGQQHQETSFAKASKMIPESGGKFVEPSYSAKRTSNQENKGPAIVVRSLSNDNADLHSNLCTHSDLHEVGSSQDIDAEQIDDRTRIGQESLSDASIINSQIAPNGAASFEQESERKADGASKLQDTRISEVLEASVPDSISGLVTCPDDVVGLIGPKHFWTARRAIVNQQRIFAIQVFELHRLIKVQKLLAASPDVIEVDVYLSHSPQEEVHMGNAPLDNRVKSHQPNDVGRETSSQKPNPCAERGDMRTIGDSLASEFPSRPFQFPSLPGYGLGPWCSNLQQNQWLVPVISPSEGLIYKPYSAPTVGFMDPFYGSYAPLSLPPISLDHMNPAFAVLPYLHQPPFPLPNPYVLPLMNPVIQSTTTEEVNSSVIYQQSTSNAANKISEVTPLSSRKSGASKQSNVQGSTLPLRAFESCDHDAQKRVIKVVPCNARLVTESAARIFRSIEQERKKHASD